MQRLLSFIFTLLLCLCLPLTARAATYTLPAAEVTLDIPDDLTVLTSDLSESTQTALDALGIDHAAFSNYMRQNNILLSALPQDGSYEISVTAMDTPETQDFNLYSEEELNTLAASVPVNQSLAESSIYQTDRARFIIRHLTSSAPSTAPHTLQYFTAYNQQMLSINLLRYQGTLTNMDSTRVRHIADSVSYSDTAVASNTAALFFAQHGTIPEGFTSYIVLFALLFLATCFFVYRSTRRCRTKYIAVPFQRSRGVIWMRIVQFCTAFSLMLQLFGLISLSILPDFSGIALSDSSRVLLIILSVLNLILSTLFLCDTLRYSRRIMLDLRLIILAIPLSAFLTTISLFLTDADTFSFSVSGSYLIGVFLSLPIAIPNYVYFRRRLYLPGTPDEPSASSINKPADLSGSELPDRPDSLKPEKPLERADNSLNTPHQVSAHAFCRYCGQQLPPDGEFCPYCGKPIYQPPRTPKL